jgi:hypothetical protein
VKSQIDRPPLHFYFKHRDRIEEWAKLKDEADGYARGLLVDAGNELPKPEGGDVHVETGDGWQVAVAFRHTWANPAGRPRVGVALGWGTRPNLGKPESNNGPYWGVWAGERPKDDPLLTAVKAGLATVAPPLGLKNTQWRLWPFWSVVPAPAEDWYDHLDQWAAALHALVARAWEKLADPLDGVIATTPADAPVTGADES